jgi:hypothetical protein
VERAALVLYQHAADQQIDAQWTRRSSTIRVGTDRQLYQLRREHIDAEFDASTFAGTTYELVQNLIEDLPELHRVAAGWRRRRRVEQQSATWRSASRRVGTSVNQIDQIDVDWPSAELTRAKAPQVGQRAP